MKETNNKNSKIDNYNYIIQKKVLISIFIFIFIYFITINILSFFYGEKYIQWRLLIFIFLVSIVLNFINIFILKKHINIVPYINIFVILCTLQIYYFFVKESSYIIYTCIMLVTSLSVIGSVKKYMCVSMPILIIDILLNLFVFTSGYTGYIDTLYKYKYIVENISILIFSIALNINHTRMKVKSFEDENRLIKLAEEDSLTKLLNRKAIEEKINEDFKVYGLKCMIILDLDNFKLVNDMLGHNKGDECLITVAKKMKEVFQSEGFFSRLGGDEFMVYLPQVLNKEFVINKCEELLKKLQIKYNYNNHEISIYASIGIRFYHNEKKIKLYKKIYNEADSAMYQAKKKVRIKFLFMEKVKAEY